MIAKYNLSGNNADEKTVCVGKVEATGTVVTAPAVAVEQSLVSFIFTSERLRNNACGNVWYDEGTVAVFVVSTAACDCKSGAGVATLTTSTCAVSGRGISARK